MAKELCNEEIAARLVRMYFKEIARLGYKRSLSLDETINAYYYALSRLQNRPVEIERAKKKVLKEEAELKTETKQELFPEAK